MRMSTTWDDKVFEEFVALRERFRGAKRAKNHTIVIEVCREILAIDRRAEFLGILTPLFNKEIGNAYLAINETTRAVEFFQLAKDGYIERRKSQPLNRPDDWLKDIEIIDRKLSKLLRSPPGTA
jgi:hypothetical protein